MSSLEVAGRSGGDFAALGTLVVDSDLLIGGDQFAMSSSLVYESEDPRSDVFDDSDLSCAILGNDAAEED